MPITTSRGPDWYNQISSLLANLHHNLHEFLAGSVCIVTMDTDNSGLLLTQKKVRICWSWGKNRESMKLFFLPPWFLKSFIDIHLQWTTKVPPRPNRYSSADSKSMYLTRVLWLSNLMPSEEGWNIWDICINWIQCILLLDIE